MPLKIYLTKVNTWFKTYNKMKTLLGELFTDTIYNANIIINIGNDIPLMNGKKIINPRPSEMRDKVRMNRLLDTHEILHPKTYYSLDFQPDPEKMYIIKKRFGQMGNHQRFISGQLLDSIQSDEYIQEVIPFEREFRVVKGPIGIIRMTEKLPQTNNKIRNSKSCKFKDRQNMWDMEIFVLNACNLLQIDFTGADIGIYDGQYYIIEFNSAPSLSERNCRAFINQLTTLHERNDVN